jgi:hypothetical protein
MPFRVSNSRIAAIKDALQELNSWRPYLGANLLTQRWANHAQYVNDLVANSRLLGIYCSAESHNLAVYTNWFDHAMGMYDAQV